jgi:hypothetical protein
MNSFMPDALLWPNRRTQTPEDMGDMACPAAGRWACPPSPLSGAGQAGQPAASVGSSQARQLRQPGQVGGNQQQAWPAASRA